MIPHNKIFQADKAAGANRETSSGKVSSEFSPYIQSKNLGLKKGKIQNEQFPDAQVDLNFSLWLTLHERDFQAMCILEILISACTPNPCIRESIQLLADNTDQSTQMGWQLLVFLS